MREDDCRCVMSQCYLYDFPGIDAGLRQRAPEHFIDGQYAVLRIQQHDDEYFVLTVMQKQL